MQNRTRLLFQMFEKVIRAWKDNSLDLESYGLNLNPDSPLAKEDLVAGEPESFQDDLLKGKDVNKSSPLGIIVPQILRKCKSSDW